MVALSANYAIISHMIRIATFFWLCLITLTSSGQDFCVTGLVAVVNRSAPPRIYLMKEKPPSCFWAPIADAIPCQPGDIVVALGHSQPISNNQLDFFANKVVRIKSNQLPTPQVVTGSQLNGGEYFSKAVSVTGVLASAIRDDVNTTWNLMTLRTPTGKVYAALPESELPLQELVALKDADVRLTGLVTRFGIWRSFLGYELMLFGKDGLKVLTPPKNRATTPPFKFTESLHRCHAEGVVLAVGRQKTFLRTSEQTILPITLALGVARPQVGELLTVIGFTEPDQRNLQLVEAEILSRVAATGSPQAGLDIDPETLYADESGRNFANTEYYGKILRLTGTIVNSMENIHLYNAIILACGKRTVSVDISALANATPPSLIFGSTVAVTGLCLAEFENDAYAQTIPRFKGFTLIPRTANDLEVLSRPSWWTPTRLLVVIAILLLLIVAILVWNRALGVLSERRGQELAREQIRLAEADLKVEERTRLAVELHDSISQTLTGIAFQIETARGIGGEALGAAKRFLDIASQMLTSCRQELRRCLWDLRSRTFEEKDLTEAIQRTIAPHTEQAHVVVRFNVPREALSEATAHTILKIVRELVVNAIRHGKARTIRIAGEYLQGRVRFSVTDDGTGFDTAAVPGPEQGHFGLQGIRERAAERNGTVEIDTHSDRGTRIVVTLMEDSSWQGTDE